MVRDPSHHKYRVIGFSTFNCAPEMLVNPCTELRPMFWIDRAKVGIWRIILTIVYMYAIASRLQRWMVDTAVQVFREDLNLLVLRAR